MKITIKKTETKKEYEEVIMREPTAGDILEAQRIAGSPEGLPLTVALLSLIATFDGQKLTYEDIKLMPMPLFFELAGELTASGLMGSADTFSISPSKADLIPAQS